IRHSLPGNAFEQGNLSALEEEPAGAPLRGPQSALGASSGGRVPGASLSGPLPGGPAPAKRGGTGSAALGLVVLVLALAAAGAAWFSGLIPH
ncbi:MAG TPA: hypothetical protein VM580_22745, partial [Labilithrix sp.]|nr:hypothetical protein [Labilithrix sp.]